MLKFIKLTKIEKNQGMKIQKMNTNLKYILDNNLHGVSKKNTTQPKKLTQQQKIQFTLIGPINAGKTTFIKNLLRDSDYFEEKLGGKTLSTTTYNVPGLKKPLKITDISGFSDQSGLGWSRLEKLKQSTTNAVFVFDCGDKKSWQYFKEIYQKCNFRPVMVLGNQRTSPSQVKHSQIWDYCSMNQLIYHQFDFVQNYFKCKIFANECIDLITAQKKFGKVNFTISLIGKQKSGKNSLGYIISNEKFPKKQPIEFKHIIYKGGQITIRRGPGFSFKNGPIWSNLGKLANQNLEIKQLNVIVIVVDLNDAESKRYLEDFFQILTRDYQVNLSNVLVVGNRKQLRQNQDDTPEEDVRRVVAMKESTKINNGKNQNSNDLTKLKFKDIEQVFTKFNKKMLHYIEVQCNQPYYREVVLKFCRQIALLKKISEK